VIKDADRIAVFGRSGSGKSTLTKTMLRDRDRVVVVDPMEEYARARGFVRADRVAQVLVHLRRSWSRSFRIAFVPAAMREPSELHALSLVLLQAQAPYYEERDDRKLTLVVEELNKAFPVAALPRELYGFGEVCSRGRHYGIEVIGVSQRPAEVNTRFRGNTTASYWFALAEAVDETAAARALGRTHAARLRQFPTGRYLRFAAGEVTEGSTRHRRERP
jgi:DNA helicase HerA-like ATPase